jgi:uncharacterized protein YukE
MEAFKTRLCTKYEDALKDVLEEVNKQRKVLDEPLKDVRPRARSQSRRRAETVPAALRESPELEHGATTPPSREAIRGDHRALEQQLAKEREDREESQRQVGELKAAMANLEHLLATTSSDLKSIQDKLEDVDKDRKKLASKVFALQGCVRIVVRVRPLISTEAGKKLCLWKFSDNTSLEVSQEPGGSQEARKFKYDRVFDCDATQEDVFNEVKLMTESVMTGSNVCILAYG